jgi:hypothetical protein
MNRKELILSVIIFIAGSLLSVALCNYAMERDIKGLERYGHLLSEIKGGNQIDAPEQYRGVRRS